MSTKIDLVRLKKQLSIDEGYSETLYKCSKGKLTIGIGRNIEDRGLNQDEVDFLFLNDIKLSIEELERTFPFFKNLTQLRQEVLINMHFNLGLPKMLTFKNMIEELENENYLNASDEMIDSLWYKQNTNRVKRLAQQMIKG